MFGIVLPFMAIALFMTTQRVLAVDWDNPTEDQVISIIVGSLGAFLFICFTAGMYLAMIEKVRESKILLLLSWFTVPLLADLTILILLFTYFDFHEMSLTRKAAGLAALLNIVGMLVTYFIFLNRTKMDDNQ